MTDRWYSNKTQVYWTCKALIEGRVINHMDEIGEVRGWRLGAIIHRLKHEFEWPILVEYRGAENIAHYSLKPATVWMILRFPKSAASLLPPKPDDKTDGKE